MNYHPDDFLGLIEEVEQQGGAHLTSDRHKPGHYRLNLPVDEDNPTGPKVNKRVFTTGCHRTAQFLVTLLPDAYFEVAHTDVYTDPAFDFDDAENPQAMMSDGETPALVKACAVDDAMGLWPRFQSAMTTGESFEPV